MPRRNDGPASQRQLRMGEVIRRALVEALGRADFRDPLLNGGLVTVTEVRPSPDLRHATVFVTRLGGGDTEELVEALTRARAHLRGLVARDIRARFTPELHFRADASFDEAARIGALIREARAADDAAEAARLADGGDSDDIGRTDDREDADGVPPGDDETPSEDSR